MITLPQVVGELSNDSIAVDVKPKIPENDDSAPSAQKPTASPMSDEAISAFLSQVAGLIKYFSLLSIQSLGKF